MIREFYYTVKYSDFTLYLSQPLPETICIRKPLVVHTFELFEIREDGIITEFWKAGTLVMEKDVKERTTPVFQNLPLFLDLDKYLNRPQYSPFPLYNYFKLFKIKIDS